MDQRYQKLCNWVAEALNIEKTELSVVSGDASFRRYFRFNDGERRYIAMDAPPEKEDSNSFVCIARSWREQGLNVPELIKVDLSKGFLLLSDFGDALLLPFLKPDEPDIDSANKFYGLAMQALLRIQCLKPAENYPFPLYNSALLQREMSLFPDWLLEKKLGLELNEADQLLLASTFRSLEASALAQPQVLVHRDFHARNLMVLEEGLGIIDFQDAVVGPLTYDLVSLLRDCYIVWPDEQVEAWCRDFYLLLGEERHKPANFQQFKRDFDLMGMQRHLKAAGIFARLSLRDGKHGYLNDIPRTVQYIHRVAALYPEFQAFTEFLEQRVLPELAEEPGVSK